LLKKRKYKTKSGSTVVMNGGIVINFDWFEENACCDCLPNVNVYGQGYLTWYCDECGHGEAKLEEVNEEIEL